MTITEAIDILTKHNAWRRDISDNPPEPFIIEEAVKLGIAIDYAISIMKEYNETAN